MTTTQQPARPAHVPEDAAWNGEQWFIFSPTTGTWEPVPEAAAPKLPPLPAPGAATNGQGNQNERPAPVYAPSIAEYLNQRPTRGGDGKMWKYHQMPEGTWYEGVVARDITRYDTVAQTDAEGNPLMQNGQYRFQMQVPVLMAPIANYPDGRGVAVFKVGDSRDKLNAAMEYAGAPLTTEQLEDGSSVSGYVPQKGAYIKMVKTEDQKGTSQKGSFTRYIYEVTYRCPDDPFTVQKRAGIEAAHKALEELGPPPEQPASGSPAQAFIDYANALTAYQTKLAATTNGHPAPATTAPPIVATAPLPPPATAAPPVPAPAPPVQAVQAAATHVATADAGLPPAGMPTPAPQPPVPPPASTTPAPQPPVPPPASTTPAPQPAAAPPPAPAAAPATAPVSITREQWQQMALPVRHVVSAQTGIPIPEDLRQ